MEVDDDCSEDWKIKTRVRNSLSRRSETGEVLFFFHSYWSTIGKCEWTDDESENEVWKQERISSGPGLLSSLNIYRSESEGEDEGELLTQEHRARFRRLKVPTQTRLGRGIFSFSIKSSPSLCRKPKLTDSLHPSTWDVFNKWKAASSTF